MTATPDMETVRLEIRGNLLKFFNGMRDPEIIFDGPAGTGKTRIILERQHYIQQKYPFARGIMLRRYRSSMNETCMHIFRNEVLRGREDGSGPEGVLWKERDQKWVYPNHSEVVVCGLDDPQKVMSSMYDWAYGNEILEIHQSMYEDVSSRLRNFKIPYQQWIGDTNPGPPSHWIKKRAESGRLKLLPTFHKDNPVYWNCAYNLYKMGLKEEAIALVFNPDPDQLHITLPLIIKEIKSKKFKWRWTAKGEAYVNNILRDGLTGLRRKRLYDGEWAAAEGQVYDMWNPEVHVVRRFRIPSHWQHIWTFDFGFVDPLVWQDWVQDPDTGILYLNHELYHTGLRVEEACKMIKARTKEVAPYIVCDHDAENRATVEFEFGQLTLPAFKSIHRGIQGVQKRLQVNKQFDKPTLFLFDDAPIAYDHNLIDRRKPTSTREEFECYVWDTKKISEDKYKDMPVDKDNHGMDASRYAVAFVDDLAIDPAEMEVVDVLNADDDMVQISEY